MTTEPVLSSQHIGAATAIFVAFLGVVSCARVETTVPPVPVEDRAVVPAPPPAARTPAPPVPAPVPEPPAPEPVPAPVPEPAPDAAVARPAAVVALVRRQESASRAGNATQAAAELERALRISPRDRELWLRLARIRLQQRQWPQAESMAMKCLSLSAGDAATARSAWDVVAAARTARGDAAGAAAARQQAAAIPAVP